MVSTMLRMAGVSRVFLPGATIFGDRGRRRVADGGHGCGSSVAGRRNLLVDDQTDAEASKILDVSRQGSTCALLEGVLRFSRLKYHLYVFSLRYVLLLMASTSRELHTCA